MLALAGAFASAFTFNVALRAAETAELRGEVSLGGVTRPPLTIELFDTSRHQRVGTTIAGPDGSFQFRHLEEGRYELEISNGAELLKREIVEARAVSSQLYIHVDSPLKAVAPSAGGTISMARLRHKAPRKAVKLVRNGTLESLQNAVALDPDYMEAQNNLGCRYLQAGDYARALQHLQRAAELDPTAGAIHTNLAVALYKMKRAAEAEAAVRRGMELGDTSAKADYVLAVVLIGQGRRTPEAFRHLHAAAGEFPAAMALESRFH